MSFTEVITKIKEELGLGQEEGFPEQKYPARDVHRRMGSNMSNLNIYPHAEFEQMHPAVNKENLGPLRIRLKQEQKNCLKNSAEELFPGRLPTIFGRVRATAAPRTPILGWVQIPMQNSSRCIQQ